MKKLYHYTTLETLALILKTKKLRFNRLDLVDDVEEASLINSKVCTHYFVSCWTFDERENISLWNMYSKTRGVRITTTKIPIETMKQHSQIEPYSFFETPILDGTNRLIGINGDKEYLYFPFNKMFRFYPIEYKSQDEVLKLKLKCVSNSEINMKDLGGLKSDYWSFQNEVRMIIKLDPYHPSDSVEEYFKEMQKIECDFEFLDFQLNDDFINNIEVTLGPLRSDSDRIILDSLLKNYTTDGKAFESELLGKIKIKN